MQHNFRQLAVAAVVSMGVAGPLAAQEGPAHTAVSATVAATRESPPVAATTDARDMSRSDMPSLVIMGFESGTVSAQIQDRRGFAAILGAMHGSADRERYDPSQLGIGIADMLVEKLLQTGQFRILERKADGTSGAKYIVTGSVTKFGFEERNIGGAFATVATMGLLSYKQHKTEVALTARVIDAATGEIVASMTAEGASAKGGGLRVAGIGGSGGGGADINSANFRSTAIGQATGRAVANLAEKISQKKSF